MHRWMLVVAALLGASAVMSGAFGAHALKGVLDERATGWYHTAVTYHATHALALFGAGLLGLHVGDGAGSRWLRWSGLAFTLGVLIFSGTLYAMAFTGITKLGMITPLGGVSLISAWLCLAMSASRLKSGVS